MRESKQEVTKLIFLVKTGQNSTNISNLVKEMDILVHSEEMTQPLLFWPPFSKGSVLKRGRTVLFQKGNGLQESTQELTKVVSSIRMRKIDQP